MDSAAKTAAVVFRLRYVMHLAIYLLGFLVPWDRWLDLDSGRTAWLMLAAWLARNQWASFNAATVAVLVLGIFCTIAGAALRTWGAAYLGGGVVQDAVMHGGRIVASGPYRHLRNPLYLGTWIHTFALAMLMPPSGAVFSIIAIGALQMLLIWSEEQFLASRLGAPYAEYCQSVPRLLPRRHGLGSAVLPEAMLRPRWTQAVLAEIYMWGVAFSFAALGWKYNAFLLTKCVLIALGVSIVARAFPGREQPAA